MAEMGLGLLILGLGGIILVTYVKIGMWLWCKLDESEKSSLFSQPKFTKSNLDYIKARRKVKKQQENK